MKLEPGQVAVVTGAATGIGAALCMAFAQRGLSVVLSDVDSEALASAEQEVAKTGVRTMSIVADVSSAADVDNLAAESMRRFGAVDVVCNNAGVVGSRMPSWQFDHADWEWIFGVNLWGVIHGLRAFVPLLVARGRGHILNTASMAGLAIIPGNSPYNASKHAVVSISETLRAELREHAPEVGVTVLCPGPTRTRLATEGARWRPSSLAPEKPLGALPRFDDAELLSPTLTAQMTLEAIEHDQLYVAPNVGSRRRVEDRVNAVLSEVRR